MKYNLRNIAEVEELKQVKGIIYKITNEITQKVYIGETLKSFNERYSNIFTSHNKVLQADIYDYGIINFTVELLEKNIFDDELLRNLEELYIKRYKNNTYNVNYNKSIICLNDLKIFPTVKECVNYYNLSISNLYAHLLGYRNYSQVKGKTFMYLCEYEK